MAEIEWLTKDQAAKILKISPRRVLEYAQAGALKSQKIRDPEKNQMTTQVHAGDVERLREERENPTPQPPQTSQALVSQRGAVARTYSATARKSATREAPQPSALPPSELRFKLFLTEDEAVTYTGWGRAYLVGLDGWMRMGPRGLRIIKRERLEAL